VTTRTTHPERRSNRRNGRGAPRRILLRAAGVTGRVVTLARRRWTALIIVAAAPLAVPLDAQASGVEVFHGQFSDAVDDVDVCGVTVDLRSEGVFTDKVFFDDEDSLVRVLSTVSSTTTLTADNGKSVVIQFANLVNEGAPVVDEEAGTITFVTSYKGLPEKISVDSGPVLLRDAGVIVFANTFDFETGELISSRVLVSNGPHPDADSDFALFCEVIAEALG
jgi:hypothetical protein